MMKAVAERFGYARSAVMAIEAGADMVLAQGSQAEQLVAINALREAFASGRLTPRRASGQPAAGCLAAAYPARAVDDAAARAADHALMARPGPPA
jgi:beta-N-acetylhexosaminidase